MVGTSLSTRQDLDATETVKLTKIIIFIKQSNVINLILKVVSSRSTELRDSLQRRER